MGNINSSNLINIPVEEQPYKFLNGKVKLCRILNIQENGVCQIAFYYKRKILRFLFFLDSTNIPPQHLEFFKSTLREYFRSKNDLVYIKFTIFKNNLIYGHVYREKKDIKKKLSFSNYFQEKYIYYMSKLEAKKDYKLNYKKYLHAELLTKISSITIN